jgi:hypothetical protein
MSSYDLIGASAMSGEHEKKDPRNEREETLVVRRQRERR